MFKIEKIDERITLGSLELKLFEEGTPHLSKRQQQANGIEYLLKKMFTDKDPVLQYTEQRKPYLSSHPVHLSISHSHDLLMILVNNKEETGVDVELIRDKVKNVRFKFTNVAEQAFTGEDTEMLITVWAAKEAMYKAYGKKEVDFAEHMNVKAFQKSDEELFGSLAAEGRIRNYRMKKEKKGDYILVYILNEV